MSYKRSFLMEERLADNRQRILKAARALVAEGGFNHASIAAVAASAGLSAGGGRDIGIGRHGEAKRRNLAQLEWFINSVTASR